MSASSRIPGQRFGGIRAYWLPRGRVIILEPAMSVVGRLVYGICHGVCHHEPLGFNTPFLINYSISMGPIAHAILPRSHLLTLFSCGANFRDPGVGTIAFRCGSLSASPKSHEDPGNCARLRRTPEIGVGILSGRVQAVDIHHSLPGVACTSLQLAHPGRRTRAGSRLWRRRTCCTAFTRETRSGSICLPNRSPAPRHAIRSLTSGWPTESWDRSPMDRSTSL